jgi:hypothetical protein
MCSSPSPSKELIKPFRVASHVCSANCIDEILSFSNFNRVERAARLFFFIIPTIIKYCHRKHNVAYIFVQHDKYRVNGSLCWLIIHDPAVFESRKLVAHSLPWLDCTKFKLDSVKVYAPSSIYFRNSHKLIFFT